MKYSTATSMIDKSPSLIEARNAEAYRGIYKSVLVKPSVKAEVERLQELAKRAVQLRREADQLHAKSEELHSKVEKVRKRMAQLGLKHNTAPNH